MKRNYPVIIRCSVLIFFLILIEITKLIPSWGEAYARSVYPGIAAVLSSFSGLFPFSVGDFFILLSVIGLLFWPVYSCIKGISFKKIFLRALEFLLLIYVWFYIAWGLNYSQKDFYHRTEIEYTAYNQENFKSFLDEYIKTLNNSYVPIGKINKEIIQQRITAEYKKDNPGIHSAKGNPRGKTMLISPLFSKMGISGYMGPFLSEFNVNRDTPISQYPTTYAHEFSHFLGITSEAEANFYAYLVCSRSDDPAIRFCGYFSVMNYILSNARGFLSEDEYRSYFVKIKPAIIDLAKENREHWNELYSPLIGDIQSWIYDLYLKGNKISTGRKNYSEVVGLMLSWYNHNCNL